MIDKNSQWYRLDSYQCLFGFVLGSDLLEGSALAVSAAGAGFLQVPHSAPIRQMMAPITPRECQKGELSRRAIVGTVLKTAWCSIHRRTLRPSRGNSLKTQHLVMMRRIDEARSPTTASLRYCSRQGLTELRQEQLAMASVRFLWNSSPSLLSWQRSQAWKMIAATMRVLPKNVTKAIGVFKSDKRVIFNTDQYRDNILPLMRTKIYYIIRVTSKHAASLHDLGRTQESKASRLLLPTNRYCRLLSSRFYLLS